MKNIEKLILFDLDGTLIDSQYNLTDESIRVSVEQAEKAGWSVGLNSDTPLEQLLWWSDQLGMTGPIIAEKGAVVAWNGDVIYEEKLNQAVEKSKELTYEYLLERDNTAVVTGNATKNVKSIYEQVLLSDDINTVVYLNTISTCSLRYFVRKRSIQNQLKIDDLVTQAIYRELTDFEPDLQTKVVDNNPEFGLIIVSDAEKTKRSGLETLLTRCSVGRVVMVGNSINDYVGQDIAQHYCVANTVDEFGNVSQRLGTPITSGCVEILSQLK